MLEGSKVILRPIEESDTDNILKWRNSLGVKKYFCIQEDLTREDHLNWYNTKIKTGKVAQFIIIDKESNQEIGSTYLRDIDYKNKKAEFGIFIGEELARGKGCGLEATILTSNYGFNDLNLNKISLRVFEDNIKAINVYKRAGFEVEGTFKNDIIVNGGEYKNLVFMARFSEKGANI